MIEEVQDVTFTPLADCTFQPFRVCALGTFERTPEDGQSAWKPTMSLT